MEVTRRHIHEFGRPAIGRLKFMQRNADTARAQNKNM